MTNLPVKFSLKETELLMEAAKVLLSLTTGFLVVLGGTLKYVYEKQRLGPVRWLLAASILMGVLAVAGWTLAIGATVNAGRAFDLPSVGNASDVTKDLNWVWSVAIRSMQVSLLTFFGSAFFFALAVIRAFWRDVNAPDDTAVNLR